MDSMSKEIHGPASRQTRWGFGHWRRIAASVAASAFLLGSGAAIGIAATGGASAAVGPRATAHAASLPTKRCGQLARKLGLAGHLRAARRAAAFCGDPLLRLAAVGGVHGQVTFESKNGARTLAFERGTVESVSGSILTVKAPDGTSMTWDLLNSTVVRHGRQRVTSSSLSSGDLVLVVGPVVSGANDARLIRVKKAA